MVRFLAEAKISVITAGSIGALGPQHRVHCVPWTLQPKIKRLGHELKNALTISSTVHMFTRVRAKLSMGSTLRLSRCRNFDFLVVKVPNL